MSNSADRSVSTLSQNIWGMKSHAIAVFSVKFLEQHPFSSKHPSSDKEQSSQCSLEKLSWTL